MIYHISQYLAGKFYISGIGMFNYISFRSALAIGFSLLIAIIFGAQIIKYLRKKQIGETIRDLGLEGEKEKKGTPTMGGVIIILSIIIPTLLFCDLTNVYVQLMIVATLWLGGLGFIDDYIKVFKKNKEGLSGRFKIIGQVGLGLIVGLTMWHSQDIAVREVVMKNRVVVETSQEDTKALVTTIPFNKNNEFNYKKILNLSSETEDNWSWVLYVIVAIFVITAVSNGANLTDGLDGLAAGTSAIVGFVLLIFAYVSGNAIYAHYLNIMYIPHIGELVIFGSAFVGALIGFVWYNGAPAQVFMGDTGSLAIGGIIATFALLVRKELLLPLLCIIFLVEVVSVLMQRYYFKYTKKKYGEGRRIFLMSPLHHHYQKKGIVETKIVLRMWIIQLLFAVATIATLKMR
ncbi:MAG: phospho-N-acetylmuramoyl-pentapeptide-transferase [Rikenellaceae bacterium]